jgi:periplasmic nitrate reductase NapD
VKVNSRFGIDNEASSMPGGLPAPKGAFNVCGVLVHVARGRMSEVTQNLSAMPGVEIHAEAPDGRLVITVEDTETELAANTMVLVNRANGVMNSSLVYHQFESHDSLELEDVS